MRLPSAIAVLVVSLALLPTPGSAQSAISAERPDDPFVSVDRSEQGRTPGARIVRGAFTSVQVNVDGSGLNIVGDAANEPSIAVDPTDPRRIAIGWRQFDTIASNFRQAGWAYSTDGGSTWTFPGVIEPGVFRSDPVLGFDRAGIFYYDSLSAPGGPLQTELFRSTDGGQTWGPSVYSFGGDKAWMNLDRSGGIGDGNIYAVWNANFSCCGDNHFNRSTDGGDSFEAPILLPDEPFWGTLDVGPDGELYVVGASDLSATGYAAVKSTTVQDPMNPLVFDFSSPVEMGGPVARGVGPNPGGLLGQVWVAVDSSSGSMRGNVYMLSSVDPAGNDPNDVHFTRSLDGGVTWSPPVRVNDDVGETWQWFGTMAVSPSGRIDVVWNDTRNDPGGFDSELYHSYSVDAGSTWSPNEPLSPPFDPHLGWPQQEKIGDYYHMVSVGGGSHLTWAATFNGEQDVYYLFIPHALFDDGFESGDTSAWSATVP